MQRAAGFCLAKGVKVGERCMQAAFPLAKVEKREKRCMQQGSDLLRVQRKGKMQFTMGFCLAKGVKMEESCMQQGSDFLRVQKWEKAACKQFFSLAKGAKREKGKKAACNRVLSSKGCRENERNTACSRVLPCKGCKHPRRVQWCQAAPAKCKHPPGVQFCKLSLCKDANTLSTCNGAKPPVQAPSSTHLEEAAAVHAPAGLHGDALAPVEDETLIALAALEALVSGASAAGGEAGARPVTSAGAELVVAVRRAGERWRIEKQKEKHQVCYFSLIFSFSPHKNTQMCCKSCCKNSVQKMGLHADCFSLAKASPKFHARCFPFANFSKYQKNIDATTSPSPLQKFAGLKNCCMQLLDCL